MAQIHEHFYGLQNVAILGSLNLLALVLDSLERPAEAEPIYKRIIALTNVRTAQVP